jgi:NTE family protein
MLKEPSSRKVGLALSGGGARGLAHIGVLKVLEREGVPIDYLAGTSMGGVVAALYAAGLSPGSMEEETLRMTSPRRLLGLIDRSLPRRGLFEGQKVQTYLASYLGDRTFDDLRIPLTVVAVDLNTGREVYLNQGRVIDAVRATIAIPGIFTPVERDGQCLVDGGLLDNLPADAARRMGADLVIAVDVFPTEAPPSLFRRWRHRRYVPNEMADMVEVLYRALWVLQAEVHRRKLSEARPEIVIQPTIPPDAMIFTGFPRAAEIIAAGESTATEAVPQLRSLVAQ